MYLAQSTNWGHFEERGKPEYPEKNLSEQGREPTTIETQPTYDAETGNRTRATLVGSERSHHCAIPAPACVSSITDSCSLACLWVPQG